MKLSYIEAAEFIENFVNNKGGAWDWDDFTSIPIDDLVLKKVQERCIEIHDEFPATGAWCSEDGVKEMRKLAAFLREVDAKAKELHMDLVPPPKKSWFGKK